MDPLIDAEALAERLDDVVANDGVADDVVVLDVRWRLGGPPTLEDFLAGHIPGARWADLDATFAGAPGQRGRHPLPAAHDLQQALRELGIDDGTSLVVYDAADSTAAARAWWVLRWAGLADVRVLDGGLAAWTASGRELEAGPARHPAATGTVTVRSGGMPAVDAPGAADLARAGVLLDARIAARYRGEVEPIDPVAGHIPGARSAPTDANVAPDGRLLPAAVLRQRFAELGVDADIAVGAYCGSGVTAAHTVLALEVAGYPAALYPGSWSEWITDPTRPVATGDATPTATEDATRVATADETSVATDPRR